MHCGTGKACTLANPETVINNIILILKTILGTCEQYHSHEYDSSLNRFGRSTISQSDNEKAHESQENNITIIIFIALTVITSRTNQLKNNIPLLLLQIQNTPIFSLQRTVLIRLDTKFSPMEKKDSVPVQ